MEKTFHAYCWDDPASGEYDNLTTMVDSMDGVDPRRMTPAEAKAALDAKPAGRRFLLDNYSTFNSETTEQLLLNASDKLSGYQTCWFTNGINSVHAWTSTWWNSFFAGYLRMEYGNGVWFWLRIMLC